MDGVFQAPDTDLKIAKLPEPMLISRAQPGHITLPPQRDELSWCRPHLEDLELDDKVAGYRSMKRS